MAEIDRLIRLPVNERPSSRQVIRQVIRTTAATLRRTDRSEREGGDDGPDPTKPPCRWTMDADGIYESSCGRAFTLIDGGPRHNEMAFCCYCGRRLVETDPSEGEA